MPTWRSRLHRRCRSFCGRSLDILGVADDHWDLLRKQVRHLYPVATDGFTGHNLATVEENPVPQGEEIRLCAAEPVFNRGSTLIGDRGEYELFVEI